MNHAWAMKPIGEIFDIGAGKTMSKAAREGSGKVPFLRTSNVLWDEIDLTELDEMAIEPAELQQKSLALGDLLVCEGGEIGRAAVWTGAVSPVSFQNHLHRLRPSQPGIEPRFYVYFLQSAFTQLGLFAGAGNKTTIPNLSRNQLAALEVPQPSPQEQCDIARVLRAVRLGVTVHERSAAHAVDLQRTAMRELFTRGLRGEPQKETEIGLVPASWEVRPLAEVGTFMTGGTPPKSDPSFWKGPVPWVSGKDLKRNRLHDVRDHISEEAARDFSRIAPRGSILMLVRGMGLAKSFALSWLGAPMAFNQDLRAIVPNEFIDGEYLMHALTHAGERMLRNTATAAHGTKRLTLDDLANFLIPVPRDEEQREIIATLDAIDRKIDLHRRKRVVLEELFKSLLHKLMTGEIRVADLDLSALPALAPMPQGARS